MSTAIVDVAGAGAIHLPRVEGVAQKRTLANHGYFRQATLTSLPLIVSDVFVMVMAACCSAFVINACLEQHGVDTLGIVPPLAAAFVLVNALVGLYPGVGLNPIIEFRHTCVAATLLFWVFAAAMQLGSHDIVSYSWLLGTWCLSLVSIPISRSVTRRLLGRYDWWGQPAIIIGSGWPAMRIYRALESNRGLGLRPVGLVEDSYCYQTNADIAVSRISPQQAAATVRRHCVYWAIVAVPEAPRENVLRVIERIFLERYPRLMIVPNMTPLPSLWNRAYDCGGMPGIRVEESLLLPLPRMVKRGMDVCLAIVGGLLLLPLFGLICLLIKAGSHGPVFYSQRRIGQGACHFHAWKFRTMAVNADEVLQDHLDSNPRLREEWQRDHKLKNDPRVTWIGHWLRKSSLDELPQIWNVLRGEMSFVGPRPIVDDEIDKYGETFQRYLKVLPGITGLWQISGRNNTTYQERVELDSYYVRNWSPWLDVYILLRTIKVVLFREGAY